MLPETDATRVGWGEVLNRSTTASGHHAPDRASHQISLIEMGVIQLALHSFSHLLPPAGLILRFKCATLWSLWAPSQRNRRQVRPSWTSTASFVQCWTNCTWSCATSMWRRLYVWVDRLSRAVDAVDSTDWSLAPAALLRLDRQYGPHTLDLFASLLSARCVRFC